MTASRWLCAAAALLWAGPALAFDPIGERAAIDQGLDRDYPQLQALFEDLHSHPELGFQETRTAAHLAREMRALGFEVTEHVGRTGVVAIYRNGPGPTVLVRTEMDALPMEERTGLPYASRAKGVWEGHETFIAHSCGHDAHMTIWVGTARALLAAKARWRGTLMFIAQPSEEPVDGAQAMLDDGLFTRFGKPDLGFALHVVPAPYGVVMQRPGPVTSNSDSLEIRFQGRGGHGSQPQATIDPVLMAARFVVDVQGVVSREKDPAAFGVVTLGAIEGGSAGNIIPDSVTVRGTIRSYEPAVRDKLLAGIDRTARASAQMSGAPAPDIRLTPGAAAVVNDPALTARTAAVFKAAFGAKAVDLPAPASGSEDYSAFVRAGVPSVYFAIGSQDPAVLAKGGVWPTNHAPTFAVVPEPTLRTGVEAMSLAVQKALAVP